VDDAFAVGGNAGVAGARVIMLRRKSIRESQMLIANDTGKWLVEQYSDTMTRLKLMDEGVE